MTGEHPSTGGPSVADGAEFLRDVRWVKVFIPTITHALYVSLEPFVDWTSESPALLKMVQHAFNLSFDNITFTLSADDPIVQTVGPLSIPRLYQSLTTVFRPTYESKAESRSLPAVF